MLQSPVFTVFIEALEFYAYHGVGEAEQSVGHRYVADVEIDVRGRADRTDNLEDTVDYGEVARILVDHAQAQHHRTLERLGDDLAGLVLESFPMVEEVRLRLGKRLPPAPFQAEVAGVDIVRTR